MKELLALKRKWILLLIPITLFIIIICRSSAFIAEYIFARFIFRILSNIIGIITRWFPFSIAEICLYLLPIVFLFVLIRFIYKAVKTREKRASYIGKGILNSICFVAIVFFFFVILCGTNYYRYSFEKYLFFDKQEYTKDDLYALCDFLVERVNEAQRNVKVNSEGVMELSYESTRECFDVAGKVISDYAKDYPAIKWSVGKVKPVLASKYMSYTKTVGIYIPFTMEANVNIDTVAYNQPADAIHELAHLRGIMREDEANYIAYAACVNSKEPDFIYSGYMLAYIYATNQLYEEDIELYRKVREKLSEGVIGDLRANSEYWSKFETPVGNTISNVSNKVNNTYLNLNGQEQGTKSYGMVVDLLIAEYKELADEIN